MKILFAFLMFMYPLVMLAQQISLNGVVKSTEGDNLPLGNIFIVPDSLTITAGIEGNYPSNVAGGKGYFNLYIPDVRFFIFD